MILNQILNDFDRVVDNVLNQTVIKHCFDKIQKCKRLKIFFIYSFIYSLIRLLFIPTRKSLPYRAFMPWLSFLWAQGYEMHPTFLI